MKENKGIYCQIRERNYTKTDKITEKDIRDFCNMLDEDNRKKQKEQNKTIKDNIKYLNERSKELNKPIPPILLIYTNTRTTQYVGSDFIEQFKEWL